MQKRRRKRAVCPSVVRPLLRPPPVRPSLRLSAVCLWAPKSPKAEQCHEQSRRSIIRETFSFFSLERGKIARRVTTTTKEGNSLLWLAFSSCYSQPRRRRGGSRLPLALLLLPLPFTRTTALNKAATAAALPLLSRVPTPRLATLCILCREPAASAAMPYVPVSRPKTHKLFFRPMRRPRPPSSLSFSSLEEEKGERVSGHRGHRRKFGFRLHRV